MSDNMQVIVKIAERCNLNCAYCYMYTGADQSWRLRPRFLSKDLRNALIERAGAYLAQDPVREVTLELHGGEPLLLGLERFEEFLADVRRRLGYERAIVCLQTNGTLFDESWRDLFEHYHVSWSISSDGPPQVHDRFRLYHSGAPSSADVERAIALSLDSPLFGGVLSVIDPTHDGAEVVRYFYELGLRQADLLLPDASHAAPPQHLPQYSDARLLAYLRAAFDEWIAIGDPTYRIRIFEQLMRAIYGVRSRLDAFGGNLWGMLVVESDGSYQLLDVLRLGGQEEVATALNLAHHSFDDFLATTEDHFPGPSDTCRACPVFQVCGGGYLPHRFDGVDYDRPSVYCDVLYGLIAHIYNYMRQVTPQTFWEPASALETPWFETGNLTKVSDD